nr:hypothetical protein [uncultured Flavobacterium sp.]
MRNKIVFFLLLISSFGWSQRQVLKGKITANVQDLEGIHVINFSDKNYVTTTDDGYFSINAKPGDTLRFSAVHLAGKQVEIKKEDFGEQLFVVRMNPVVNRLSELIIKDYSGINAESLGLVKKGQKKFTPAERRLNAASNPYAVIGTNASAGLDPLLNWISGRTAMLEKEVEVEKKERFQNYLKHLHEEEYYVSHFKIPADYVSGFLVYASENSRLTAAIISKNKILTNFLLGELAVEYCKRIANDK